MLQVGMLVDNCYKIVKELGRGGTSCVFLAENIRLHNYRAIKEIYKNGIIDEMKSSDMLMTESNLLTKLRHPRFPLIIDVLDTPESYLIVMEYIEGTSLAKVLEEKEVCSQEDVLKWGQQLCDVLQYLHSQEPAIIYRDMKPANVMLKPDGNIVLIDFGMAREFKVQNQHDTTYLGTHGYAAPEQYNDKRQSDARTDIYSLGVTLYHLVTGHDPCLPPYGIQSICTINPSLSPDLDAIIQKCTKLEPEDRFQSAYELNEALKSVGQGKRVKTVNFGEEPEKKSNKWLWSLTAIPVVIIAVIIAVVFGMGNSSNNVGDAAVYYEQEVNIDEVGKTESYTIVPEVSGYYEFFSNSSDEVPAIWLSEIDSDGNLKSIDSNNTDGENKDFYLRCMLEEGKSYCLDTSLCDDDPSVPTTGSYWIYVEYSE